MVLRYFLMRLSWKWYKINAMTTTNIHITFEILDNLTGKRLDQALSILAPNYSRTLLQSWIKAGYVKLDNQIITQQRTKVTAHQNITIDAILEIQETAKPQKIKLNIIYEDKDIIVINKPAGLVVHPGAGCKEGTLMNALLYSYPELATLPRAGIIHRLDKDTSGILVIARNLAAHKKLVEDLQQRKIKREYVTIVWGKLISGGMIDANIGRHKTQRTHMAVVEGGKKAVTHYRVLERFEHHTCIQVMLETGRTHQIRVHMAHINHPIVGDPTYGGRLKTPQNAAIELRQFLSTFKRQALHAMHLTFNHPRTDKQVQFTAPIADDIQQLLNLLHEQHPK